MLKSYEWRYIANNQARKVVHTDTATVHCREGLIVRCVINIDNEFLVPPDKQDSINARWIEC